MPLRNLLLATSALIALAGVAMLARQSPAVGVTALGLLLVAGTLAERLRHARRGGDGKTTADHAGALSDRAQDADIVEAYRFFLGRDPESQQALSARRGLNRRSLIGGFLASDEYARNLVEPALEDRSPSGGLFDGPPAEETLAWASDVLPLGPDARRTFAQIPDWVALHAAMLCDSEMRRVFPEIGTLITPERADALATAARLRGPTAQIEEAAGRLVRGYALDRAAPEVGLTVELWLDGAFVASVPADGYRRDLEERFGGSGLHGFVFEDFGVDLEGERPVRIEVRNGATKRLLAARRVTLSPDRETGRLAQLGAALDSAHRDLAAIAEALRQATAAVGFTPASYGAYRRAYYLRTPAGIQRDAEVSAALAWRPRFDVVVTGDPLDRPAFDATDAGVAAQVYPERIALRAPGAGDYVLLIDAGDRLAPDALLRLAAAVQGREPPPWLTFDSDTMDADGVGRDPVFRPAFDPDLLLQTPYLGSCAAVRADVLRRALEAGGGLEPEVRGDLWLRLSEAATPLHIPRVLHHAAPSAAPIAPDRWARDVRAHLARIRSEAAVHEGPDARDPVAPATPRIRVAWPLPAGTKAAVIVPTRDRLDLLGPCLASLEASRSANRTTFEIVVVDNASTDPATLALLEALEADRGGQVIRHPGAFNWSAINNLAARAVEADVLVFLNNDTVVLTPAWCDALCAQALRPEIGGVGARLLYADGSLQHAGLILGTAQAVAAHEGTGAPARDPGYLGRRALAHRAAAVTGACLATRRELFLRLGGFDEAALAIEANDVDFCLRVRHEGLAVLYEPQCTLHHFESRSRGHTGFDAARRARADAELASLERRWGDALRDDPFYNGHFDRGSRPFARLGPPPEL